MNKCYGDYIHYGKILFTEDFDFTKWGGKFFTIKLIDLNGVKMMFILANGEVEKMEYIGVE